MVRHKGNDGDDEDDLVLEVDRKKPLAFPALGRFRRCLQIGPVLCAQIRSLDFGGWRCV